MEMGRRSIGVSIAIELLSSMKVYSGTPVGSRRSGDCVEEVIPIAGEGVIGSI